MKHKITYMLASIFSLATITSYASCTYIEIPSSPFKLGSQLYSSNGFDTHEQYSVYHQCWNSEPLQQVKIRVIGYPQYQDSSFPSFPQPINGATLDTGMHVDPHGWIVVRSKDISGSNYSWNVEVTNYAENGNQNGSRVYHCRFHTNVRPFPLLTTHDTMCT